MTRFASLEAWRQQHTFGLSKVAFFDTSLESTVEHRVKLSLTCVLDLVVGLHVLLDGLAAEVVDKSQHVSSVQGVTVSGTASEMCICGESELTCCHFFL